MKKIKSMLILVIVSIIVSQGTIAFAEACPYCSYGSLQETCSNDWAGNEYWSHYDYASESDCDVSDVFAYTDIECDCCVEYYSPHVSDHHEFTKHYVCDFGFTWICWL